MFADGGIDGSQLHSQGTTDLRTQLAGVDNALLGGPVP